MFAVIVDVKCKELFDFVGVGSLLDLPVINSKLYTLILNELKYVGFNEIVIYSERSGEGYVNSRCELNQRIKDSRFNNVFVLFSNTYAELSSGVLKLDTLKISSAYVTDKNGNVAGFVFDKNYFINELCFNGCQELFDTLSDYSSSIRMCCADFVCKICSLAAYKNFLTLILKGESSVRLPEVAEGIYASGKISNGDYVLIPPVFIGTGVQIETGCVIGPYSIISDNTLVSGNTHLKATVLLKDNYISSGCFLEDVLSCENVSVLRNSAVFGGSCLGHHSFVSEETCLENNSRLRAYSRTGDYIKKDEKYHGYGVFNGCTPEYAALIGGAFGTIFNGVRVGILIDGELNSRSLKHALISGFISSGVQCLDLGEGYMGAVYSYVKYCDLDYAFYIKGGYYGVCICIINRFCEYISKDIVIAIKDVITKNSIERASEDQCYDVRSVNGLKSLYIRNILNDFDKKLNVVPVIYCDEKNVNYVADEIISRLTFSSCNEQLNFNINEDGTSVTCKVADKLISHSRLNDFVSFYTKNSDDCTFCNWRYDAVSLAFKVVAIISEYDLDFYAEISSLPSFYVAEKYIDLPCKFSRVVTKLSEKYGLNFKQNELHFQADGVDLKIVNEESDRLKIIANSSKLESSEEIIGDIERFLTNI